MLHGRLAREALRHPRLLCGLMAVNIASIAGTIGQALCLASIIQGAFAEQTGWAQLRSDLVLLLGLALWRSSCVWLSQYVAIHLSAAVQADMRERIIEQVFSRGVQYSASTAYGTTVELITSGVNRLDGWFSSFLPQCIGVLVTPVCLAAAVWQADVAAAAILFITGPLIPVFMLLIGTWAKQLERRQWKLLIRIGSHFLDVLEGIVTLKVFGRSREQMAVVARVSEEFRAVTLGVLRVAFLSAFMLELLATLGTALAAVTAGFKLLYGLLAFRDALFILLLAPEFYLPFRALGGGYHAALAAVTAAEDVFRLADDRRPEMPGGEAVLEAGTGLSIVFQGVSVEYPDGRKALAGVSFSISPGETLAIVGASGSGKTTLTRLLLRAIQPSEGRISVNGHSLSELRVVNWLEQITYVPQQPHIFFDTVAANIAVSRSDACLDDIISAARMAGVAEVIERLPQQYRTLIGNGGMDLSLGEKRRIALARAFLRDAPLIILDEPTASLDSANEQSLFQTIRNLTGGRTVIVIAHRMTTVLGADRVLVLEQGRVIQSGTPARLANSPGKFSDLLAAFREEVGACE